MAKEFVQNPKIDGEDEKDEDGGDDDDAGGEKSDDKLMKALKHKDKLLDFDKHRWVGCGDGEGGDDNVEDKHSELMIMVIKKND